MVMFLIMGLVIVVALLVIGLLFYFMNKESQKNSDGQAVPIMDVSELKGLSPDDSKDEGFFSAAKSQLPMSSQEELNDAKSKLAALEKGEHVRFNKSGSDFSLNQDVSDSTYPKTDQSQDSTLASNSQHSQRIKELESQITLISQKAIEQAEEAVKVIEALMKENSQLKTVTSGFSEGQTSTSFLELKERTGILENQLDLSSSKVSQLETQIVVIKKELGQQLLEANATIARLKVEGEAQERVTRESLLKEKDEIEEARQASARQVREMEDGFIKMKEENLLLKDAKKLLEAKLAVIEDDFKNELSQSKEMVTNLAGQKEAQADQISHMERDISKLKELNSTLIDKAKILQYELNRYRAQSSGLERVCENFKTQMEEMFNAIEQTKKDNNRLLQERINLEAGVVSLRTENSKLAERDKVYQQELEKTKEQVSRFEKIYKNFKTNVGDLSDSGGSQ